MKVTLYIAISADGFIAGPNDETPWSKEEWQTYSEFVRSKGNLIIGHRTYELMKSNELKQIGNPFTVVLSTKGIGRPNENTHFVKTPLEAITLLRDKGFSEAVLGGGGTTNELFLEAGLIDDVILDIESVFLGGGIQLFGKKTEEVRWELIGEKKISPQLTQKHYRVLR